MPRRIKYTPTLVRQLCKLYAEGMTVKELSQRDDMPQESVIWKWRREKPTFKELFEEARQENILRQVDEYNTLTKTENTPTVEEIKEKYGLSTPAEINAQIKLILAQQRERTGYLKNTIAKIAPKMLPEFADKSTVDVKHEAVNGPIIHIMNYSDGQLANNSTIIDTTEVTAIKSITDESTNNQ